MNVLLLKLLSWLALAVTGLAPVLHAFDRLSEGGMKSALLAATFLWFACASRLDVLKSRQTESAD